MVVLLIFVMVIAVCVAFVLVARARQRPPRVHVVGRCTACYRSWEEGDRRLRCTLEAGHAGRHMASSVDRDPDSGAILRGGEEVDW